MIIGVTGGVGAGKSTILKILEKQYDAHLIMADDVAKELMLPGGASYEAVVKAFGKEILEDDPGPIGDGSTAGEVPSVSGIAPSCNTASNENTSGMEISNDAAVLKRPIDRKKLAAIVFEDDAKLELLNSLTHPKVKEEILARIARIYQEDPNALIVLEAALLIEAGYRGIIDSLWAVLADREVRVERLMEKRGYSREKALSIMDSQLSDEEFRAHADVVIDNSGSIEETAAQIAEVMRPV